MRVYDIGQKYDAPGVPVLGSNLTRSAARKGKFNIDTLI